MLWIPQKDHVALELENIVQDIMQAREFFVNNKTSLQYCIDHANYVYTMIVARK